MRSNKLGSSGTKYDKGKNRLDLIPTEALEVLAEIYTRGASKYAQHNWAKGMAWSRPYGALLRHALAFWRGEETDSEFGTPHILHVAWNAIALYMYSRYRRQYDDRYNWHTGKLGYGLGLLRAPRAGKHKRKAHVRH